MSDVATQTRLAKVVQIVDPDLTGAPIEVVIDVGAQQGVKPGDRYLVFGEGPDIRNPYTGKDTGPLELVRGRGKVVELRDRSATVRSVEWRLATKPQSGSNFTGIRLRPGKLIEGDPDPNMTMPFEHVRLGDQARPI
jgi:hypothetical protein